MKIKVDLHTHSIFSHDGGITLEQYEEIITTKRLDYVAITDHNEIEFALEANKTLGDQIIVGEEIMTLEGEVIGLYLKEKVPAKLSLEDTIQDVKRQNGLIYIPHPFDVRRSAISTQSLNIHLNSIDIVEIHNSRTYGKKQNDKAKVFANKKDVPGAAGSDAHSIKEIGNAYSILEEEPKKESLAKLLRKANHHKQTPRMYHIFTPKINKFKKIVHK